MGGKLRERQDSFQFWEFKTRIGICLVVQWLRLHAFNAGDTGLIPGQGIKVPHVVWCGQKNKIRKDSR